MTFSLFRSRTKKDGTDHELENLGTVENKTVAVAKAATALETDKPIKAYDEEVREGGGFTLVSKDKNNLPVVVTALDQGIVDLMDTQVTRVRDDDDDVISWKDDMRSGPED